MKHVRMKKAFLNYAPDVNFLEFVYMCSKNAYIKLCKNKVKKKCKKKKRGGPKFVLLRRFPTNHFRSI